MLAIFVVLQTIRIIIIIYLISSNRWLAYILVLIFLGGLLIIFIYLSALIPNNVFYTNIFLLNNFLLFTFTYYFSTRSFPLQKKNHYFLEVFRLNHSCSSLLVILLFILSALFSIIFILEKSKTPLKNNTYETSKTQPYF